MERKFHDIQQDDDWLKIRLGFITSSNFACIMAHNPKKFGDPAVRYAQKIAVESVTGNKIETYTNQNMLDGIEKEQSAREMYEEETMQAVSNGGFMEYGQLGSSSDGLVGEDGMVEIKNVLFNTHFTAIENGFDNKYKYQVHGQMWIYNRKWADWVSCCDAMPKNKQLVIVRIDRDESIIKEMDLRLKEFIKLVQHYKEILK